MDQQISNSAAWDQKASSKKGILVKNRAHFLHTHNFGNFNYTTREVLLPCIHYHGFIKGTAAQNDHSRLPLLSLNSFFPPLDHWYNLVSFLERNLPSSYLNSKLNFFCYVPLKKTLIVFCYSLHQSITNLVYLSNTP